MSVSFQERKNNTAEQVREYLSGALELVAELEPPEDLRGVFFAEAVRLLSGKQVISVQGAAGALSIPIIEKR